MANESKQRDQKDILAENEKLTAELAAATGRASALEISNANLSRERDDARAALRTANENVAAKDTQLTEANGKVAALTTLVTDLTAKQSDFDGKVAARVAELGINPKALTQPKAGAAVAPGLGAAPKLDANGKVIPVDFTALCTEMAANGGAKKIETR